MQPTPKIQALEQPKKQWINPEVEVISVQSGTVQLAHEGGLNPSTPLFKFYAS